MATDLQRKRAPLTSDPNMQRIVQQIYDDINEIINSVNSSGTETRSLSSGKEGDVRVIKDKTSGDYKIEAFTEDGWAETSLTISK